MQIRYTLKDKNTVVVSIEGLTPAPIVYTMVKVKPVIKTPKKKEK